jgi:hypothetical protein
MVKRRKCDTTETEYKAVRPFSGVANLGELRDGSTFLVLWKISAGERALAAWARHGIAK